MRGCASDEPTRLCRLGTLPRVIRLLRLLLYFSLWKQLSDFRRWEATPMLALQDADMALNETRMIGVASTAISARARQGACCRGASG